MTPTPHTLVEASLTIVVALAMHAPEPARRSLHQPTLRVLPAADRDAVLPPLHALSAGRQECRSPLSR
jgi:hypothetical protein